MAVRYYDKVFMRPAGGEFTSLAKSALSSWGLLPTGAKVTQELGFTTEPDVTTAMGDGTDEIGSEATNCEMQLVGWDPAALAAMRTELINRKVDILIYDSRLATSGWVIFGIQVYPTPEIGSNKEPVIKLSGKVRYGSDVNPALVPVTLT